MLTNAHTQSLDEFLSWYIPIATTPLEIECMRRLRHMLDIRKLYYDEYELEAEIESALEAAGVITNG